MSYMGRYKIITRLASGGMAEIYLAELEGDAGFRKQVAIKRLLPSWEEREDLVAMLVDEGRALARLQHRNIVQIYELAQQDGEYFLVMEFVPGLDLRRLMKLIKSKSETLPVKFAAYIAAQVLEGLIFAQKELHIVHRDISPSNILISWEGAIKVADFGIARGIHRQRETTGHLKGKFSYMSPEQAMGEDVDERTDVFAAGIVFYEMLSHARLFDNENDIAVLEQVRKAKIPREPIKDLPPELRLVLLTALAKEKKDRYGSAEEFLLALNEVIKLYGWQTCDFELGSYLKENFSAEWDQSKQMDAHDTKVIPKKFLWSTAAAIACCFLTLAFSDAKRPTLANGTFWQTEEISGSVSIKSVPSAAKATIKIGDEIKTFTTPFDLKGINLSQDVPIDLNLEHEGYKPTSAKINLTRKNPDMNLTYSMLPIGRGYLSINAVPWGIASVLGSLKGAETPVSSLPLSPGSHSISVRNGDRTASTRVQIASNQHMRCFARFPEGSISCK